MTTDSIASLSTLTGQSVTVEYNPHLSQGLSLIRYLNQQRFVGVGMTRTPERLDEMLQTGVVVKVSTQFQNTIAVAMHGPTIEYCVEKLTTLIHAFNQGALYDPQESSCPCPGETD